MLSKEEHIKYWIDTAKKDWRAVQNMYKSKDYRPALFFAHLHLEEPCKALRTLHGRSVLPALT